MDYLFQCVVSLIKLFMVVNKELNKTTTGRLNNGVPQVPPARGASDLESFRQTLPVYNMRDEIVKAINENKVILLSGETGSGKTTQVSNSVFNFSIQRLIRLKLLNV